MQILIVDDHPLVRRGLKAVLSNEPNFQVAGEAMNSKEAMILLLEIQPDLSIIDLRLAEECGLDFIRDAKQRGIRSKFILLSSSANSADFIKAEEVLVDGFVLKEALPEELIFAIHLVLNGRKYYDPGLMEKRISQFTNASMTEELTPKEREVLIELGQGSSNRIIAENLYISEFTVKKHVSNILYKLQVTDRTQAALYANAMGITKYDMSQNISS